MWAGVGHPGVTQTLSASGPDTWIVTGRAQLRIGAGFLKQEEKELTGAVTKPLRPHRNSGEMIFYPKFHLPQEQISFQTYLFLRLFPSHALLLLKAQSNNSCEAVIALINVFVGF